MKANNTQASGISAASVLFIVFLVLKLTDNIDWSWWWVTSPIWIPIITALILIRILYLIK